MCRTKTEYEQNPETDIPSMAGFENHAWVDPIPEDLQLRVRNTDKVISEVRKCIANKLKIETECVELSDGKGVMADIPCTNCNIRLRILVGYNQDIEIMMDTRIYVKHELKLITAQHLMWLNNKTKYVKYILDDVYGNISCQFRHSFARQTKTGKRNVSNFCISQFDRYLTEMLVEVNARYPDISYIASGRLNPDDKLAQLNYIKALLVELTK